MCSAMSLKGELKFCGENLIHPDNSQPFYFGEFVKTFLMTQLYPFCNDGAARRHYKMDKVEDEW
jgi:hypothetical protein